MKAMEAPLEPPCFLMLSPAGITPHEQRGRGTPRTTAFKTPLGPLKCRRIQPGGSTLWIIPAEIAPKKSQGASITVVCQASCRNVIMFGSCLQSIDNSRTSKLKVENTDEVGSVTYGLKKASEFRTRFPRALSPDLCSKTGNRGLPRHRARQDARMPSKPPAFRVLRQSVGRFYR